VRTEYAGSYVIERPGREILGLLKQISGSVYMARADLLKKFGWGTSITEDFELTLKLYEAGYKVIYTPYVQAPAECVSTLKRLIRQRMRWSEGHSHCIKKMFLRLMTSPKMTLPEKLEVLYISPYYLQAFFFLVGTFCWLMAETVFRAKLPFWTSLWGWSLVLTNFFSLPLMNTVGLFLEESEEKDYLGLLSFVALSYIMVPFQAYASIKGFIEKEEGPWFRTPKTGRITDIFTRGKFYRWIAGILPGRRGAPAVVTAQANERYAWLNNPHVVLATANNQFNNFKIKPKRIRWVSKAALAILLIISSTILSLTQGVPEVLADDPSGTFYLGTSTNDSTVLTSTASWQLIEADPIDQNTSTKTDPQTAQTGYIQWQPGAVTTSYGTPDNQATGTGWIFDTPFESDGYISSDTWTFKVYTKSGGYDKGGTAVAHVRVYRVEIISGSINSSYEFFNYTDSTNLQDPGSDLKEVEFTTGTQSQANFTSSQKYLYVDYWIYWSSAASEKVGHEFWVGNSGSPYPRIVTPSVKIPEKVVYLIAVAPFIPMVVLWMRKRKFSKVSNPINQ